MESSEFRSKTIKKVKVVRRRLVGGNPNASDPHLEEYLNNSKSCLSIGKKLLIFKIVSIVLLLILFIGSVILISGTKDINNLGALLAPGIFIVLIGVVLYLIMGVISIVRIINSLLCIGRTMEFIDDVKVVSTLKEGKTILTAMIVSIVLLFIPYVNTLAFIANGVLKYCYYKSYKRIAE